MHPRSADPATPDIGPRASGRADPSGHCVAGRPRFGTADAGASESVEVAASYVEAEALANAAKHAQASEVTACAHMHPEMTTTGNTNTSLTVPAIAGGRQPLSALTRAFDRAETARRRRSPPYGARPGRHGAAVVDRRVGAAAGDRSRRHRGAPAGRSAAVPCLPTPATLADFDVRRRRRPGPQAPRRARHLALSGVGHQHFAGRTARGRERPTWRSGWPAPPSTPATAPTSPPPPTWPPIATAPRSRAAGPPPCGSTPDRPCWPLSWATCRCPTRRLPRCFRLSRNDLFPRRNAGPDNRRPSTDPGQSMSSNRASGRAHRVGFRVECRVPYVLAR